MILASETLDARLPDLRAGLSATLAGDGRITEYTRTIEQIEGRKNTAELTTRQREQIRVIKTAVDTTSDAAHTNIRSYRNWLLILSGVVSVSLILVAIAHLRNSEFLFIPEAHSAGKHGADIGQLEAAGAVGGLLMALFALIRLTVYAGPVALPLWQALVRIPAGAAAGLVGAALLQSKLLNSIVPQTRSGLLGYAVLFGAAPEILLRFLDGKVNAATAAARPKNDPLKSVPAQGEGGEPEHAGLDTQAGTQSSEKPKKRKNRKRAPVSNDERGRTDGGEQTDGRMPATNPGGRDPTITPGT